MALNPEQFGPFANMGAGHARLAYEGDHGSFPVAAELRKRRSYPVPAHVHEDQGQLFDPNKITRPEPHQQTPAAFAADDRNWWHGRFQKSPRLTKGGSNEGFHAGSRGSAIKRLEHNASRRGVGDTPARMFPLRLVGQMGPQEPGGAHTRGSSPDEPGWDRDKHTGLADRGKGYFYKNEVEDAGHISVGVPKREGYLATHRDLVEHAQSEGKFVHPNIAWAAKKMPQHTGEDVMAHRRRTLGPQFRQPHLGEESSVDVQMSLGPQWSGGVRHLDVDRRSYVTESGKTQHVYRFGGDGGWSPTHA